MKKLIIILVFIILLVILFYPKPYDKAGGFDGISYSNTKKCLGFSYSYYRKGCNDCFAVLYCAGWPITK